jgi:hypothetical protein
VGELNDSGAVEAHVIRVNARHVLRRHSAEPSRQPVELTAGAHACGCGEKRQCSDDERQRPAECGGVEDEGGGGSAEEGDTDEVREARRP